jgi:hypothetical protein
MLLFQGRKAMPGSSKLFRAQLGAALATWLALVCLPLPADAQPSAFRNPQFVATAISFKALHETHWNWVGSDEVEAKFFDFSNRGIRGTHVFGDVDAGETRAIPTSDSCIAPQPTCAGGASSLAFGITLVEVDGYVGGFFDPEFCHGALGDPSAMPPTPEEYEAAFDRYAGDTCYGDDLIGRAKVKLSQADLVALLPTVGGFVDTTVALTGGDGRYEVTYRITRLPNTLNIPPIGPPVVVMAGISLQVAVSPLKADLTWSGTSAANIDVYRNSAIIKTVANTGAYTDKPSAAGPYTYRVCDAGSTSVCSADVSVNVP